MALHPAQTASNFAWTIQPAVMAALISAFHVALAPTLVLAIFARRSAPKPDARRRTMAWLRFSTLSLSKMALLWLRAVRSDNPGAAAICP